MEKISIVVFCSQTAVLSEDLLLYKEMKMLVKRNFLPTKLIFIQT